MARTAQNKADIPAIKRVNQTGVDTRPLIAYVMKYSGCTYSEIAKALDTSRQNAQDMVKRLEAKL